MLLQGEDVFPIPGTKRIQYLEENVAAFHIELTAEDRQQLEAVFAAGQVSRRTACHMAMCSTASRARSELSWTLSGKFCPGVLGRHTDLQ